MCICSSAPPHEGLESSLLWNAAMTSAKLINFQVPYSTKKYQKYQKYQLQFCRLMRDWIQAHSGMSLSLTRELQLSMLCQAIKHSASSLLQYIVCTVFAVRTSREGGWNVQPVKVQGFAELCFHMLLSRSRSASWGFKSFASSCLYADCVLLVGVQELWCCSVLHGYTFYQFGSIVSRIERV